MSSTRIVECLFRNVLRGESHDHKGRLLEFGPH
jgi:hypothetical protein